MIVAGILSNVSSSSSSSLVIRYSVNHVENIIHDWKQNSQQNYMQFNFDVVFKKSLVGRKDFFLCNTLIVKSDFVKNSFAVSVQHIVLVY